MQLTYRTVRGIPIATLSGSFIKTEVPRVRQQLTKIINKNVPYLILDLTQLTFIDVRGLSVFVSTLKVASQYQGDVLLLNPTPAVRAIIELVRLQHTFSIYADESAAIAYCTSTTR
jgi:anti-sigma B factor antagonist